jgi:hypothetical protein
MIPKGTGVTREWGDGKCYAWCVCGWTGRVRNLTTENRVKAVKDCKHHALDCTERLKEN